MQKALRLKSFNFFQMLGECAQMTLESLVKAVQGRIKTALVIEQIKDLGIRSIPLIAITAISTGFVMTLQFGLGLEKYGGKPYVPAVMALSVFMEIAPVFTALMCAARVGAGIASVVGSMKVTQQIDAIRVLGSSPVEEIVAPRLIACLVGFPILTLITSFLALISSCIVSTTELGLDSLFFYQKIVSTVTLQEFYSGFFKSYIFALCVCMPACYYGFHVKEGTKGVGLATTKSVVTGSILIFVSDYFMTKLYWMFEAWKQF
jgi:phospholipid/cholesterol/gamma-HCH transport system permease protein